MCLATLKANGVVQLPAKYMGHQLLRRRLGKVSQPSSRGPTGDPRFPVFRFPGREQKRGPPGGPGDWAEKHWLWVWLHVYIRPKEKTAGD